MQDVVPAKSSNERGYGQNPLNIGLTGRAEPAVRASLYADLIVSSSPQLIGNSIFFGMSELWDLGLDSGFWAGFLRKADTGVLRFAQDDGVKQAKATAKANADSLRE